MDEARIDREFEFEMRIPVSLGERSLKSCGSETKIAGVLVSRGGNFGGNESG
jgi:hypothetical protein